jgi:hypothetical protein
VFALRPLVLALLFVSGAACSALAGETPILPQESPWILERAGFNLRCELAPSRAFRPGRAASRLATAPRVQAAPRPASALTAPRSTRTLAVGLRVGDRILKVRAGELQRRLRAERFAPLSFKGQAAYDVTGDGVEDLVFSAWSGRRARLWLLIGGDRPSLTRLPGWHGPYTRLRDLDGDGRPELETHDDSFRGWRGASQADSPAPRVVLSHTAEGWRLAPELLRKRAPSADELKARAAKVRAEFGESAPIALWATLLELEARGQRARAERFLAEAWPADRPGRSEFWAAYQSRAARGLVRLLPR